MARSAASYVAACRNMLHAASPRFILSSRSATRPTTKEVGVMKSGTLPPLRAVMKRPASASHGRRFRASAHRALTIMNKEEIRSGCLKNDPLFLAFD